MEEYRKCRRARMDERCQRRINEERKIGKQEAQKKERNKDQCGKNRPKHENISVNVFAAIMCCAELAA